MRRPSPFRRICFGPCILAGVGIVVAAAAVGRAADRSRKQPVEPRHVVEAVNALAGADIAIVAAGNTSCGLAGLPGSRAEILPLIPVEHRRLIEECARGRLRLRRRQADFDLPGMIDAAADLPECVATLRAFFAGRAVDVATGIGLSDGPYPIRFDWAVVLDQRSGTLFSFVLNCRD